MKLKIDSFVMLEDAIIERTSFNFKPSFPDDFANLVLRYYKSRKKFYVPNDDFTKFLIDELKVDLNN